MSTKSQSHEPLAIVGMGCRFPGGACNPQKVWEILCQGVDAIVDTPQDRWDMRKFYDPTPDKPSKLYVQQGGFLQEKLDQFDPLFFGISPREAMSLDPQQRLLLEVTWEAIEDGGLVLEKLKGTGVFIAGFMMDYQWLQLHPANIPVLGAASLTGNTMTMLSNKISYIYGFHGPSLTLDTACSGSLVAVHLACQSIWNGECKTAIAGGVNAMISPANCLAMCHGHFLSPDSRCMTFDQRANGYVRGEGAGVIILKSYKQARMDGDPIYALLCASGCNQDGHTLGGIFFPSSEAQEDLLRQVYRQAGISPGEIHYIEAHGTGTQAGDLAEATALHAVLAQGRKDKCVVGSIKTNIGHLEAAAGVAGLIKAALCLKHRQIPPNLHFVTPNPSIPFDKMCIRVPKQMEDWPASASYRYAGVNSFGYGGTNAHILLQEAPSIQDQPVEPVAITHTIPSSPRTPWLFPLSAHSEVALKQMAENYATLFTSTTESMLDNICYSASVRRNHHRHRLAVIANSREEMSKVLGSWNAKENIANFVSGQIVPEAQKKLLFVYTGMGPQWWGMGQELMKHEPVFHKALQECVEIFSGYAGWSLWDAMQAGESSSRMAETQIAQPANFALQVALTALWKSWGIYPDAVVGHSVGEVTAAYVSGTLSLEDAALVSYHRSRCQQKTAGKGTMLAASLPVNQAKELLRNCADRVALAAINSPTSVTFAGDKEALSAIVSLLESQRIFYRWLQVEVAYHSPQMDEIQQELLESLAAIRPQKAIVPLYSTVTGTKISGENMNAGYWWDNVRQSVQLASTLQRAIQDGQRIFLEVGPHPVLSSAIQECLQTSSVIGHTVNSLHRSHPEALNIRRSLGKLYTLGFEIGWQAILSASCHQVSLPAYPWQREKYWNISPKLQQELLPHTGYVFLNKAVESPMPAWEVEINTSFFPYLHEHKVGQQTVIPAMAFIEAMLQVHQQVSGQPFCMIEESDIYQPLVVDEHKTQTFHVQWQPATSTIGVYSKITGEETPWILHCSAKVVTLPPRPLARLELKEIRSRCKNYISSAEIYQDLSLRGLHYGPTFMAVQEVWKGDKEIVAKLCSALLPTQDVYIAHPARLDAATHPLVAFCDDFGKANPTTILPVSIHRLSYYAPLPSTYFVYLRQTYSSSQASFADITFLDEEGQVLLKIDQGIAKKTQIASADIVSPQDWLYDLVWQTKAIAKPAASSSGDWLILSDQGNQAAQSSDDSLPAKLQASLQSYNIRYKWIVPFFLSEEGLKKSLANVDLHSFSCVLYLADTHPQSLDFQHINARCMEVMWLARILEKHKAVSQSGSKIVLAIVTKDSQTVIREDMAKGVASSPLWGLGRTIQQEFPHIQCRLLDISESSGQKDLDSVVAELLSGTNEPEIAWRSGQRFVHRLKSYTHKPPQSQNLTLSTANPIKLAIGTPGILDSLHYEEDNRQLPGPGEIEIRVQAASLNFKDLLKVLNVLSPRITEGTYFGDAFGMECSGIVVATGADVVDFHPGDEVIAFAAKGCFRAYITIPARDATPKPSCIKMEESPVLIAFITAYYGLVEIARIKAKESVLIHSATGGVGLAAIQIAKWMGAEIFATAGSDAKREFLRQQGITHVMDSRSLSFVSEIKAANHGQGVDVVLNFSTGEALQESLDLLAPYGRFVEIGKRDIDENKLLPMRSFNRNLSFTSIDLDRMFLEHPSTIKKMIQAVAIALEEGHLQPLPIKVFAASEAVAAFRYMAQAAHIGKIILDLQDQPVLVKASVHQEPMLRCDSTYLISGGLRGFGLEMAQWLSNKKVGGLVLLSRSGLETIEARNAVNAMIARGIKVKAVACDITDFAQVRQLIEEIRCELPPLRGIFHVAVHYDDEMLNDATSEKFARVMAPKIQGAINLWKCTQDRKLDFWVLFSSFISIGGNQAQGNYASANAFLDNFSHYLRCQGQPAITINWGVLAQAGAVARSKPLQLLLEQTGFQGFSNQEALSTIELLLSDRQNLPQQLIAVKINAERWLKNSLLAGSPIFAEFARSIASTGQMQRGNVDLLHKLSGLKPDERQTFIADRIKDCLSQILQYRPEQVDIQQGLDSLGFDSLVGVELVSKLQADFGIRLAAMELLQQRTIAGLTKLVYERMTSILPNDDMDSTMVVEEANPAPDLVQARPGEDEHQEQSSQIADAQAIASATIFVSEDKPSAVLEIPERFYNFEHFAEYQTFQQHKEMAEQNGVVNPYFRMSEAITRATTMIQGREFIDYAGYNYLGLCGDPRVSEQTIDAIRHYGTSVSSSRLGIGEKPIHRELERELADLVGAEDSVIFLSGHGTNVNTIGHLFKPSDLIVYDEFSHNSITQGAYMSRATMIPFAHSDCQSLEKILREKRPRYERVLIVVEGVYSMDGDIPDLPHLIELKKHYCTLLMVDEAHSMGVLGKTGRGIREYFGVNWRDVDLWMGTLSKSFASCGGYIAGAKKLVEYLRYTSPGVLYSVGMSPANTASALAAVRLMKKEPERVVRLQNNARFFLNQAKARGLSTGLSFDSPVIPVMVGDIFRCLDLSQKMFSHNINVLPAIFPSVAMDAARLRFFITSEHTQSQMEYTLETLVAEM